MNVLVSAFSCGPGRGSEPGMGWNWVQQVSRRHEVWLLTTDEFASDLTRELGPSVHPLFIRSFARWERLRRLAVPGLHWLYYYWWQWKAYRLSRRLHAHVRFDIAFHVTFGSWRAPSFLCLLGIPLVWGPIGGGETLPRRFRGELGWKGRIHETLREGGQKISKRDPFVRLTMRRAAMILAGNEDTARMIPDRYKHKLRLMPVAGISRHDAAPAGQAAPGANGFAVLFAGILEPRKGGGLAVRAFAELARSRPDATLCIIGQGPEFDRLTGLVRRLGMSDRVRFAGWMSRSKVLASMEAADVFLLPSLRDSGGFVLLEAMLSAKPVICLDVGGPGQIVDEHCGLKVRPDNPHQAVTDLARALVTLAGDPSLRRALGAAGRRRVLEHFDWDKRGMQMLGIFDGIVQAEHVPEPVWVRE